MKITIGDWHRVSREAQKNDKPWNKRDDKMYRDQLESLQTVLGDGRHMLNLGFSGYRPLGGRAWEATDGAKVIATLADLVVDWGGRDTLDLLGCDEQYMLESLVIPIVDQENFEVGQMRGDWT